MSECVYKVLQVFAGIGGGCRGFQQAKAEFKGVRARFETIGAIDVDPLACADLTMLTGAPATPMDLFTLDDYRAFHGCEPPEGWQEVTPADIRAAAGGKRPDVVFGSPPCKGFSGLLSNKRSTSAKYQALNRLVVRWLFLVLEAWADNPPGLLLLENVPRIRGRGRSLLDRVGAMLRSYGYAVSETVHDCGELGALAQTRKRFLLVARHVGKVNALLYEPIRQKLRTIGDIVGPMSLPEAAAGGPMHTLPRIQRRTWERLALIRAGKDWKDLERRWAQNRWAIEPRNGHEQLVEYGDAGAALDRPEINRRWYAGVMGVNDFGTTANTVTGRTGVTNGPFAVADPRPPCSADSKRRRFNNVARVAGFDEHSPTVTGGAGPSSGGICVADPRAHGALGRFSSKLRVEDFDQAAHTVIGAMDIQSGALSVADPRGRMGQHSGKLRVEDFDGQAHTVTSSDRVGSGAPSVADPRLGCSPNGATLRVVPFDRHSPTVIGTSTTWSSGSVQVADPRLGCSPRNGTMGVRAFDESFTTVTGNIDVHAGTAAVADPRRAEVPIILSDDGCWHRPLTTLELAALQGFPVEVDGAPLKLAGKAASRWRMGIGNAVPPPTARAIAEQMLRTLLVADAGAFVLSDAGGIWVREADGVLRWHETSRATLVRCSAEATQRA